MSFSPEERTDVTVLEMQSDGSSEVIHTACEWLLGRVRVVKAFHQMLIRIVGRDVMDQCMTNCSDVYDDISLEISIKLRAVDKVQSKKITLKVPVIIMETFEDSGLPIQDAVDQANINGKIIWSHDKMRMDANVFRELCADALDSTRLFVHGVLAHRSCKETDVIIMTGEFSSSPLLQESIKSAFSNMRVIIPPNNEHAALVGAVIFAHARLPFKPQCSSSDPQVRSRGKYPPYRHRE
ncbi:heat shock 70 kDa protein 12B-like [Pecten maximus]|uniref:heat shock 70 kDa protein 12B-like n=1 Tax=Pecten maximus TaxID=6579 RepID=UPI00145863BC|nr:heat shock 70 kDa protein 12B-like [Pecten maximus]